MNSLVGTGYQPDTVAALRPVAGIPSRPLTTRQQQCVELRAQGLLHKEIAYRLGLTEGTVKVYCSVAAIRAGVPISQLVVEYHRRQRLAERRARALVLAAWLAQFSDSISKPAYVAMKAIVSDMVSEVTQ